MRYSLVYLIAACLICSCNSAKKLIVKDWEVVDVQSEVEHSDNPEYQDMLNEFRSNASMVFKSDGTYYFNLVRMTQKGTWEIVDKGKKLITIEDKGKRTETTIVKLTQDKLVLKGDAADSSSITMVMEPRN